jgi:hypothetical protein
MAMRHHQKPAATAVATAAGAVPSPRPLDPATNGGVVRVEADDSRWPECSTRCTATTTPSRHEVADHVVRFHAEKDPLVVGRRVEFLVPGSSTGLDGAGSPSGF